MFLIVSIIPRKIIHLYRFLKFDVDLSLINGGCWPSIDVISISHLRQIHDTTVFEGKIQKLLGQNIYGTDFPESCCEQTFTVQGLFEVVTKKFHLGISKIMQFFIEKLEKIACYSYKSRLIATKVIILYYLRIILSIFQKSEKSHYAFLLKTSIKKRYPSV